MRLNTNINPLASDAPETPPVHLPEVASSGSSSSYKHRLNRWAIAWIEATETHIVAHFRSYSDAEGHLRLLRQKFPKDEFAIVVDKQTVDKQQDGGE